MSRFFHLQHFLQYSNDLWPKVSTSQRGRAQESSGQVTNAGRRCGAWHTPRAGLTPASPPLLFPARLSALTMDEVKSSRLTTFISTPSLPQAFSRLMTSLTVSHLQSAS